MKNIKIGESSPLLFINKGVVDDDTGAVVALLTKLGGTKEYPATCFVSEFDCYTVKIGISIPTNSLSNGIYSLKIVTGGKVIFKTTANLHGNTSNIGDIVRGDDVEYSYVMPEGDFTGESNQYGSPVENMVVDTKPDIRDNKSTTLQLDVDTYYILDVWHQPSELFVEGLPEGLIMDESGLIKGLVTGEERSVDVTFRAINNIGEDIKVITFNFTEEAPEIDPTAVEGGFYIARTGEPNSDRTPYHPFGGDNSGIPLFPYDDRKKYYVRIGVPYFIQIGASRNGAFSGDLDINLDKVFSDVYYYNQIGRLTGLPSGEPRTETLTFTATNKDNGETGTHSYDFELLKNVGASVQLEPYGFDIYDITMSSMRLRWYNREHERRIVKVEIWKDDVLWTSREVPDAQANGGIRVHGGESSAFLQFKQPELETEDYTWKIRNLNDLGEYSPFSNEFVAGLLFNGRKPEVIAPFTGGYKIKEYSEFQLNSDIPATNWTVFNLPRFFRLDGSLIKCNYAQGHELGQEVKVIAYARNEEGQSRGYPITLTANNDLNEDLYPSWGLKRGNGSDGLTYLIWNNRSYIGGLDYVDVWKNGSYLQSLTEDMTDAPNSSGFRKNNSLAITEHLGTNTWKVKIYAKDGTSSDFSEEFQTIIP